MLQFVQKRPLSLPVPLKISTHRLAFRFGPSIHIINGSILGWTSIPQLPRIIAPTLVYNGEHDTSHDIAQEPFFELIPLVRWVTFPKAGHMCHLEGGGLRERFLKVVGRFLVRDGQEVHESEG